MKRQNFEKRHLHDQGPGRIHFSHAAETGIIIAIFIAGFFALRMIAARLFKPVCLIDDSSPSFEGVNGYGTIENYHPEEKSLEILQEEKKTLAEKGQDTAELDQLIQSIDCGFDKTDDLENGEKVTYACSFDQAAALKAGYSIRHYHRSFTVMDLKQIETIDPFDYIDVSTGQDNAPAVTFFHPLDQMPLSYEYTVTDASHIQLKLVYNPEAIARCGFRFSINVKDFLLETDTLIFDQSTLSHLSEESREKINRTTADLPLNEMINQSGFMDVLPEDSILLENPSLLRWTLAGNGRLKIVFDVNTKDSTGLHTWEITASWDIYAKLTDSMWEVMITSQKSCTIDQVQQEEYYSDNNQQVK